MYIVTHNHQKYLDLESLFGVECNNMPVFRFCALGPLVCKDICVYWRNVFVKLQVYRRRKEEEDDDEGEDLKHNNFFCNLKYLWLKLTRGIQPSSWKLYQKICISWTGILHLLLFLFFFFLSFFFFFLFSFFFF